MLIIELSEYYDGNRGTNEVVPPPFKKLYIGSIASAKTGAGIWPLLLMSLSLLRLLYLEGSISSDVREHVHSSHFKQ